jgi:hypothetical protein
MGILFAFAAICLVCTGCEDDGFSTSMVPESPLGLVFESGTATAQAGPQLTPAQDEYFFILVWLDGPVATDMHNVYRKDGDSTFVKLNSEIIRRGRIFGAPTAPVGLGFIDDTFDIEYRESYSYRVVGTNSHSGETDPSEAITLVPADIDLGAQVAGLEPDNPYRVGLNPTFSWDPVSGAASYCIVLLEETQFYGNIPKWVYQTTETSVSLESTDGVTYVNGMGTGLLPDTDYSWILWAVNSGNIGYGANVADFSTTSRVATVLNADMNPGRRSVEWDQIDYNGAQTPPGGYELRFTAADYDTTLDFQIFDITTVSDGAQAGSAQLPERASVWMDSYTHQLGTTIEIHYDLPAAARVRMQVFAK